MTEFLSGLLGGCAGVLVGHPFDTVKVKLQTQDYRNPLYKGTLDCFKQTINHDGVKGLYRGMASPLVGVGGINAVIFGVQKYTNRLFTNQDALSSHFMSGTIAGVTQSFICSPVELTKTRLQVQADQGGPARYKGSLDCLKQICRTDGIRGVFRGQLCTIYREAPAFGAYFVSFEMYSRILSGVRTSDQASSLAIFLAGGFAGMTSWAISYPVDVIKSRIQSDGAFGPARYSGIMDCARQSVKEEGLGVFARGLNSALIRAFPTNAATFFVVSYATKVFMELEDEMEKVENLMVMKDIMHAGQMIVGGVETIKLNQQSQITSLQKIISSNEGKFLPEVVNYSREVWHLFIEDYYLTHHAGENFEKDFHQTVLNMVRAKRTPAQSKPNTIDSKTVSHQKNDLQSSSNKNREMRQKLIESQYFFQG